jgi:hypothetical protein
MSDRESSAAWQLEYVTTGCSAQDPVVGGHAAVATDNEGLHLHWVVRMTPPSGVHDDLQPSQLPDQIHWKRAGDAKASPIIHHEADDRGHRRTREADRAAHTVALSPRLRGVRSRQGRGAHSHAVVDAFEAGIASPHAPQ